MFGVDGATGRGFPLVTFSDEYGHACSIQESSRAVCENDDGTVDDPLGWIWLGIDDPNPQIMKSKALALGMKLPPGEVSGWMPYPLPDDVSINTRMHLNEMQVRGLIERLTLWLETGTLTPNAQVHGKNSRSEAKAGFSRATPCWAMLVEHHTEQGIEWVVSFEGSNPPPEKAVHCANRDEAEKLVKLMNERPSCGEQTTETLLCSM